MKVSEQVLHLCSLGNTCSISDPLSKATSSIPRVFQSTFPPALLCSKGTYQTSPWTNRTNTSQTASVHSPTDSAEMRGAGGWGSALFVIQALQPGASGGHWMSALLLSGINGSGYAAFGSLEKSVTFQRRYVSLVFDWWKEGRLYDLWSPCCCSPDGVGVSEPAQQCAIPWTLTRGPTEEGLQEGRRQQGQATP